MSDSESDLDHTHNRSTAKSKSYTSGNNQTSVSRKSLDSSQRPGLRRSSSGRDLRCHDGYSSLTGNMRSSIQAPGDSLHSNGSNVLKTVSSIRKNYSSELEQSEKRRQDLLAEIVMEEQHSRELSKIVKDLLSEPKKTVSPDR